MDIANSVNGVPIRLTYERWYHIVENHDEMASYFHDVLEAVEEPELVVRGNGAPSRPCAASESGSGWWSSTVRCRGMTAL